MRLLSEICEENVFDKLGVPFDVAMRELFGSGEDVVQHEVTIIGVLETIIEDAVDFISPKFEED